MDIIHILSTYNGRNGKLEQIPALIITCTVYIHIVEDVLFVRQCIQ